MDNRDIIIRQAATAEADIVAAISRRSRQHFLPYLPDLHTFEEDKAYFRNVVFAECQVWVAQDDQILAGFCAFKQGWIDQLYFLPTHVGKSLGVALVNKAKEGQQCLKLWVFQQNTRAIGFYERQGFVKLKETDGAGCEERVPDALYEWRL